MRLMETLSGYGAHQMVQETVQEAHLGPHGPPLREILGVRPQPPHLLQHLLKS